MLSEMKKNICHYLFPFIIFGEPLGGPCFKLEKIMLYCSVILIPIKKFSIQTFLEAHIIFAWSSSDVAVFQGPNIDI